jgi:hypothetical protein
MACRIIDFRATPDKWEAHRPIIYRLYIEQEKTLSAVMAIMQRDYQFFGR